jgi:hypothetical protein
MFKKKSLTRMATLQNSVHRNSFSVASSGRRNSILSTRKMSQFGIKPNSVAKIRKSLKSGKLSDASPPKHVKASIFSGVGINDGLKNISLPFNLNPSE